MWRSTFITTVSSMGLLALSLSIGTGISLSTLSSPVQAQEEVTYVPPDVGAPTRRAGAGTRADGEIMLYPLAPEHTGQVLAKQPTLYWFVSAQPQLPVRIMIKEAKSLDKPLLEEYLQVETQGIHSFSLADYGVTLAQDVVYEWSVALITPEKTARLLASATIKRVAVPETVLETWANAKEAALPRLYAAAGLWYDALDVLSRQIANLSDEAQQPLKSTRASLLKQVNLEQVAEFELPTTSGS